ncbi:MULTISPECIES: septum formation initiator family protein [unclassified Gemella]|uniref:septum formation initiator family protein n=1 Tax=unclassified Gemella TaxID=2624949 RepID=UPI001C03B6BA|nr:MULTISPECIES: septum formation initiator family protein [unclassified Gemella]MBU0278994.1 septum formation initiator family protein [Gemella sp. zg-1178]QWQ38742.1 septum formation initiator family protein [Gemella sp. zg-570]
MSKEKIRKDDKNFRRDVIKAKMKYRKRRAYIILSVCLVLLTLTLVRTYFYSKEKRRLEETLQNQENQISQLQTENKVNEVIINKLKDPYFITDFVRQEYALSYDGEIIFNLPIGENYLKNASKSIMFDNLDEKLANIDKSKQINESIIKKPDEKKNDKKSEKEKKSDE